jgi:membrane protease YdiL (CAAX protease family)
MIIAMTQVDPPGGRADSPPAGILAVPAAAHPPPCAEARVSPTGRSVLAFLGVWIGGAAVLATGGWFLASAALHDSEAPTLLTVGLVYLWLPLAALVVYRPSGMRSQLALRAVTARTFGLAFLAWLAALACSAIVYLCLGLATGEVVGPGLDVIRRATDMARFPTATGLDWALIVPRALLLAGIAEELLFRGVLFGWLARHLPVWASIVVTAVLFAAEHGYYPVLLPLGLLFGLLTGWLRARTRSVLPGMAVHILTDALLLALALTASAHGVAA